jgi:hypothetical protein
MRGNRNPVIQLSSTFCPYSKSFDGVYLGLARNDSLKRLSLVPLDISEENS